MTSHPKSLRNSENLALIEPAEILRWLEAPESYAVFLAHYDGSVIFAAHALATIKQKVFSSGGPPTITELYVAAREVVARTNDQFAFTLREIHSLAVSFGLDVIYTDRFPDRSARHSPPCQPAPPTA